MKTLLFPLLLVILAGSPPPESVNREVYLMGTSCRLTVFSGNRTKSLDQLEGLIRILEETERELSTWQEGSALTSLNRQPVGKSFEFKPHICRLMSEIQRWTSETRGAFDPGIGALVRAWGIRKEGRLPSDREIEEVLGLSGMRLYDVNPSGCVIGRTADVLLDCGAFGKGEALDRLISSDPADEFSWLVNLGGQVAVKGVPPGAPAWEVAIAHPLHRDRPALNIRLTSGSLATSGGSERNLKVGTVIVGHILDPRTGRPVNLPGSVSVWHERALFADILSTALYVMGPQEGLTWAEERGLAACYLLAEQNDFEVRATTAFRDRFMPTLRGRNTKSYGLPTTADSETQNPDIPEADPIFAEGNRDNRPFE